MRSWLAAGVTNAEDIHSELPDEYAWRWLSWHLARAERKQDIEQILWNPHWMLSKLKATDVIALIADYEYGVAGQPGGLLLRNGLLVLGGWICLHGVP